MRYQIIIRAIILTVLIFVIVWQVAQSHTKNSGGSTAAFNSRQSDYPTTNGVSPGDIKSAVNDEHILFDKLTIYRARHDGKNPSQTNDLLIDMYDNYKIYGFNQLQDASKILKNPDALYADNAQYRAEAKTNSFVPYIISNLRPDGTAVGLLKPLGTRDVFAYTDIYSHRNMHGVAGHQVISPEGDFVVLWDDGQVEKIHWDKVLFVKYKGGYTYAFPGQAGLPATAMSYAKMEGSYGWKIENKR